jgi:hypothetical protein
LLTFYFPISVFFTAGLYGTLCTFCAAGDVADSVSGAYVTDCGVPLCILACCSLPTYPCFWSFRRSALKKKYGITKDVSTSKRKSGTAHSLLACEFSTTIPCWRIGERGGRGKGGGDSALRGVGGGVRSGVVEGLWNAYPAIYISRNNSHSKNVNVCMFCYTTRMCVCTIRRLEIKRHHRLPPDDSARTMHAMSRVERS